MPHEKAAIITLHPYLPSKSKQLDGAKSWGVPTLDFKGNDVSPIWIDDVRGIRTTNWQRYLTERGSLLLALKLWQISERTVFFESTLCVGFSAAIAKSTIDILHSAGSLVYVHDIKEELHPRDNLEHFWTQHTRQLKAAQMRKYRKQNNNRNNTT